MLRVDDIQAGYGGLPVLKGLTLAIERNEAVALIGANGAGKSTLVRAICGLLPLTAGRILQDGREIQRLPAHERTRHGIAVVLEGRHLFGELTVRNNLELAAAHGARHGTAQRKFRLDGVIELFPFLRTRLDAAVQLLSGGEQQMVAIARALLLQPELLILDEPSTGLSPKVVREIVGALATLRGGGMSVLLVEQNVALAVETADRAFVMALGQIVRELDAVAWKGVLGDETLLQAYLGS
jgi:ABC-type branched-subunit amino acid transport system ATPase component